MPARPLTHPLWQQLRPHLERLRKERGYSLADLASRSGLTKEGIFKLEAGDAGPSLQTLLQLLDGLGVSPARFFALAKAKTT